MSLEANKSTVVNGKAVLGIELGSTRIKAVLVNEKNQPIASGSHEWENQLVNNIWTYSEEAIWTGIQDSYQDMVRDVKEKYGVPVKKLAAIGFSAMMHGYSSSSVTNYYSPVYGTVENLGYLWCLDYIPNSRTGSSGDRMYSL